MIPHLLGSSRYRTSGLGLRSLRRKRFVSQFCSEPNYGFGFRGFGGFDELFVVGPITLKIFLKVVDGKELSGPYKQIYECCTEIREGKADIGNVWSPPQSDDVIVLISFCVPIQRRD